MILERLRGNRNFTLENMTKKVAVIDYGVGNLLSVQRSIEFLGIDVECTANPIKIKSADRVILPGVGAFGNAMEALRVLGLVDVILDVVSANIPLLGICLGMQLLFDESEEFGISKGLEVVPGRVVSLPALSTSGNHLKNPHIGWSCVVAENQSMDSAIFTKDLDDAAMYFVHSYMAVPRDDAVITATTNFGGHHIPAVISSGNVYGSQFHPEKSGQVGLKMIANFLRI